MSKANKGSIDQLFSEKKNQSKIPDDVIQAVEEIIRRNDQMNPHSYHRVSLIRTVKWIKEEMGYSISSKQIQDIAQKHLGRRSWARA
jgi:hypothetical protein